MDPKYQYKTSPCCYWVSERLRRLSAFIFMFIWVSGCAGIGTTPPRRIPEPVSLETVIVAAAEKLHRRHLVYSPSPNAFRDCSGMYHRMLESIRGYCPDIVGPSRRERSSSAIASWYAKKGRLSVIDDPIRQDSLIRPGIVMFYGRQKKRYRSMTVKKALIEISHIGIVTAVDRDHRGNVIRYGLFHGRSRGKPAATTWYHKRRPSRKCDPPLGNGTQQWIACAPISSVSQLRCTACSQISNIYPLHQRALRLLFKNAFGQS